MRNNVKQIGLALQAIAEANGVFPPLGSDGGSLVPVQVQGPYQGPKGYTLFNFLLPYIEQTALDQAAKTCADYFTGSAIPQGSVWAVVNGKYVHAHPIPAYKCPDERMQTADGGSAATYQAANESAYGNYAANFLVFGGADEAERRRRGDVRLDSRRHEQHAVLRRALRHVRQRRRSEWSAGVG